MATKLLRIKDKAKESTHWAILHGNVLGIIDETHPSLREMLKIYDCRFAKIPFVKSLDLEAAEILSPVTEPCQVICQGKNYLEHLKETGLTEKDKDFNLLFQKAQSSLCAPFSKVKRPSSIQLLDYEIELGIVLKKTIQNPTMITKENLAEFVAGVVIANDISARDVQIPQRQWFKGKSYRDFCPVGPYLLLLEPHEVPLLYNLDLELKVNDRVRQKSNTKLMIYKPEETLTEVSNIFNLYPGDIILTGTPGGVAMKVSRKSRWQELLSVFTSDKEKFQQFISEQLQSGRYLKPGDKVTAEIRSPGGELDLGKQVITIC